MMTVKSLVLSTALFVATAMAGSAATYSLGDVTGGTTTAKTLSVKTVDFLQFSLDAPSGSFLSAVDIVVTSKAGSNLRESIALYSGTELIKSALSAVAGNGVSLSFSGVNALTDGSYTLAIGGWRSFFTPDIADARSSAFFNNGNYSVTISPSLAAVPLPAAGLLLVAGMGALGLARRKKRRA